MHRLLSPTSALLFLTIPFYNSQLIATTLIKGNAGADATTSFTFIIGKNEGLIPPEGGGFRYVITKLSGAAGEFAVAAIIASEATEFIPLAPLTSVINGSLTNANPLNNAIIGALKLAATAPVVEIADDNKLYAIRDVAKGITEMVVTDAINDAGGVPTDRILGIAATQFFPAVNTPPLIANYVYSLVPPAGAGLYAATGTDSGVAAARLETGTAAVKTFPLYDATTGLEGNKAQLLNVDLGVISATTGDPANPAFPASRILTDDDIALYDQPWIPSRLYAAIPVESAAAADYGARALVMGAVNGGQITFAPIAPFSSFVNTNTKIFATGNPSTPVYATRLAGMYTTTRLQYLLMIGGNDATNYNRNAYALPLVTGGENQALIGTIADFTSTPVIARPHSRFFVVPATTPAGLQDNTAFSAYVGGTPLPLPDDVNPSSFFVVGDGVYATVEDTYSGLVAPGMYNSHAIFDQLGRIAGWTRWSRVSGTNLNVHGAGYDASTGRIWYTTGVEATPTVFNTVLRTDWNSTNGPLGSLGQYVSRMFVSPTGIELNGGGLGGVQGMASFFVTNDATIETSGIENADTAIFTGRGRIIFAYTATRDQLQPTFWTQPRADLTANVQTSVDDTFPLAPGMEDPNGAGAPLTYDITGPVLQNLGPIVAVDTIANDTERWIAVGGAFGVAVLQDPADGSGWIFGGYPNGLAFVKEGDWRFVKKIVHDDTYMYVLTNKTLDRIEISAANFATGQPAFTRLATIESLGIDANGGFMDVIVTGPLTLFATTNGLYRSGNQVDTQTAASSAAMDWTVVQLPEEVTVINALYFASGNNTMADIQNGGQVYVLDSYTGYYQARQHRLFVQVVGDEVTDTTVRPLDDFYVVDRGPSYFVNYGGFRDNLYTDGTVQVNTRPLNAPNTPLELTVPEQINAVEEVKVPLEKVPTTTPLSTLLLPANLRFGVPLGVEGSRSVLDEIKKSFVARVIKNDGSGAVLIGGDFGLLVNE